VESLSVTYPTAFLAGLVSFLSPCVLPLVPSYIAFISGMTLEELEARDAAAARRTAAVHTLLFGLGFTLVFMSLGAAATQLGQSLNRALPWINRVGGALIVLFGLYLVGLVRIKAFERERRYELAAKPAGKLGSVLAGVVFGAGWTPCIGPVLATILLLAGLQDSVTRGVLLLGTYALGLAVPFFGAAWGFNSFLSGTAFARRWSGPLQKLAGTFLIIVGLLLVSGRFNALTATLAQMGQLITIEP
jgi:cytochrome c-type biogenesis protein